MDNNPMVRAYGGEPLTGRFTTFVFGHLRDPDAVLGDRLLRSLIDFMARFFTGLELVPPYQRSPAELTYAGLWGAEDPAAADTDGSRWLWCGVGQRPANPVTPDSDE